MASFYIPLTGLNADSTALNTIANDLSNMNTTAYKGQTTNFSDLFYQQVGSSGSGNEIQVGEGVQVASNETDFSQGSYDTSGTTTSDVALNGSGFFVVSNGGSNLYTRDGTFTEDATGNLITSDGMTVMGYPAVNGVVNTNSALTAISIPLSGQVQQPEATTTFSMTANLDSASPIGTTFPAPITLYDSQGVSYQASVNYTKTGTNTWSYDITVPDTVTAAPATAAAATTMAVPASIPTATAVTIAAQAEAVAPATFTSTLTPSSSADFVAGTTTYSYNFGSGGTVDGTATLSINGQAVVIPGAGETVAALQGQVNALGISGVSAGLTGNVLTITVPTSMAAGMTAASSMVGDLTGTTSNFDFNTGGTVDPTSTNLLISGQTATGASATITAPTITAGESITDYASALTTQLGNAGITNATVSYVPGANQLSITGANLSTTGGVSQDLAATTTNYDFGSTATVDPSTSFTITGQTATGATATITAPAITAGETVGEYAAALTAVLAAGANIVGVTVSSTGGQLSITGANMTTANSMSQDFGGDYRQFHPGIERWNRGHGRSFHQPDDYRADLERQHGHHHRSHSGCGRIAGNLCSCAFDSAFQCGHRRSDGLVHGRRWTLHYRRQRIDHRQRGTGCSGVGQCQRHIDLQLQRQPGEPGREYQAALRSAAIRRAANLDMTWNILGTDGTTAISQEDSASSLSAAPANGYITGVYQGSPSARTAVTATYSNGQSQAVGQLALANVTNLQGLSLQGNGNYATTQSSGAALIGASGTDGLGTIEDSSLEESNVNISAEFSDLIIAQRAFEANAKSITTFDTVTQDTINMVH